MRNLNIGNLIVKYPIIQGGMGVGVSLSGLAAAVANEGGVGVISAAGLGLYYMQEANNYIDACIYGLKQEIRKARAKTKGIIGVNIMVAVSNFSDMVNISIEEKADIIFSGAGLPLDLPSYLKEDSITKLVPIVSSARATKIICEKWQANYNYLPDAIVVEGPMAGGHLGYKLEDLDKEEFSLEITLPKILKEVRIFEEKYGKTIPVIAAGGIYYGEDIYKIMAIGASGVQMGTRFVTTTECDASIEFKQAYINAKEEDVVIIKSPVGMPGRAINNAFLESVKRGERHPTNCTHHCIKTCDVENSPYCIMKALLSAYYGKLDRGFCFAGKNAYRAKEIISVNETFNRIKEEYEIYAQNQPNRFDV
ncbi:MAG: nitronate monooxygenase family protein [Bacteroidales bacterium]|nr:nitronate monooxygenase family protein [Bacteroidales bacterium]